MSATYLQYGYAMKFDCHCHILPGIDDGAQTSFSFRNTPDTVLPACDLLREELSRTGIPLDLVPSMEYRLIPQTWPIIRENGWALR